MSFLNKFRVGLKKTSNFLISNIGLSLTYKKINPEIVENIEMALISADIGLEVTNHLINKIKKTKITDQENSILIIQLLSKEITQILLKCEKPIFEINNNLNTVLLFIGVNGSGKTTTIGKLINKIDNNKKVLVAACDTFRAAAVEQLKVWSDNQGADFFHGSLNQDPASVAYSACEKMKDEKYDYLIIDTAGRLSNNANLLNQLIKIKSVITKSAVDLVIKTILVLDGTNGSNMINQVETFGKSLDVTGLIITKLDGTAKGGALISIAKKYQIPIHFVGLGEKDDDLLEFKADEFSRSLLDIEN
tara:strand:- start:7 stop:921 length:915 start_codon:yes stop_codon:yes gene_type:complete